MKPTGVILCALFLAACSREPETPTVPKQEKASNGIRTMQMTKAAQAQLSVFTAPAPVEEMADYLNVTGTVQPVDSRVAHVRPLARGRILDVAVRVGDRVRKGAALAHFDNMEAGEITAQHEAAEAELRKLRIAERAAARHTERNRKLADLGAVPRKEFENSQADEQAAREAVQAQESIVAGLAARLRRFGVNPAAEAPPVALIAAPISGIVIAVEAAPGEVIDADRELFTVADISSVWVQAEVYERDLGRIRTGQTAYIEVDAYPDRPFPAKVTYIGDVLDPKTRTVKVRCEVPNPSALLKLDMFAAVRLPTITRRRVVAVPESSLQRVNGGTVVFVRRGEDQFEVRPVKVGMTIYGLAEIASGLTEGEVVVTHGSFHLKSVLLENQIGSEE